MNDLSLAEVVKELESEAAGRPPAPFIGARADSRSENRTAS